jgi:hypothetical protein
MADTPTREFGKRGPVAIPAAPPVKRSRHVALLLMGTFAVGGGAYMVMPRENCEPNRPGIAATPGAQTNAGCAARGSSGGSGRSSSFGFYGGDSSRSSSATSSESGSSGVTRGGFGGFASAFGFSGRG